ncbi:hypothetical protein ABZ690_18470 [Streptomyces sp. NPDC006967]|uniref:hypothetical protein n=1 Tax=unclassified Streptomyces TaxID=2593676 RepID=UPI0033E31A64
MSENDGREEPRTAAEEVLREAGEAGRRTRDDSADSRRHRGEAGEAITPNTEAQEEAQGEQ